MVKRAISLPRDIDSRLSDLAESEGVSYSSVVRRAAEALLRRREAQEVREAYARYYSDPRRRASDEELARDLSSASEDVWP